MPESPPLPLVRLARAADLDTLVAYNLLLARETEAKELDRSTLQAGVAALLADPALGRYLVAELDHGVVGQTMITYEWSDWRNGTIWWLQSVYVDRAYRGRGVFRELFAHVRRAAAAEPGVAGLRLYVEQENLRAREVYQRLGLGPTGYLVMERIGQPA
ncbi:MAG TPA: GNAT family N-acetyltransferase [Verrucomicrobiales bacterium]|nr:GNAT family N-acetyltransferase [Verrucomicrobiales bacterium]